MTNEIPEEIKQKIDDLHNKSEFVVSWFAKNMAKQFLDLGH